MARYGKRDDLRVHEQEPFNAETARASLRDSVTATDAFYVRGHGGVPEADEREWAARIHGLVERELELSLETLREALSEREIVATLQCAGNRREGLIAIRDIPGEAPWGPGATGTAVWTGVAFADVLALAGPTAGATHVGFEGRDVSDEATPPQRYGGSIPIAKAQRPEVLLAWGMNGQPLLPVHGAPLRVVVPGYIGARSVKWLERIELRAEPWDGYFQRVAYRLVPPDQQAGPGIGVPLGRIALNCDITSLQNGDTVAAGPLTLDVAPGDQRLQVRAWDSSAASQPSDEASLWNPKGYVNNATPRLYFRADDPTPSSTMSSPFPRPSTHTASSMPAASSDGSCSPPTDTDNRWACGTLSPVSG